LFALAVPAAPADTAPLPYSAWVSEGGYRELGRFASYGEAAAALCSGSVTREHLSSKDYSIDAAGSVTVNYWIPPEDHLYGEWFYRASSGAGYVLRSEDEATADYQSIFMSDSRACSVNVGGGTGWVLAYRGICGDEGGYGYEEQTFSTEGEWRKYETSDCEPFSSHVTLCRRRTVSCSDWTMGTNDPELGGMCAGKAVGAVTHSAAWYQDDPEPAQNPPQRCAGNPCDAVSGDKLETAVDYQGENGLMLSRAFGTGAGRWRFFFEASVAKVPPPGYKDYASTAVKSTPYATAADACTHGWAQVRSQIGYEAGGEAVLSGANCTVFVGNVPKWRVAIHSYTSAFAAEPAPDQYAVRRPNGVQVRFFAGGAAGLEAGDGGVAMQLVRTDTGYTLSLPGGIVEKYNSDGQLIEYVEGGHTLTVTRPEGEVVVADEFGRRYVATLTAGRVAHVALPDGSAIDYTWEGSKLTRVVFSNGESESYSYETKGPLTLLKTHAYNDVPFASWEYDGSGRATLSRHAGGVQAATFEYLDGHTRLTEPLGKTRLLWTARVRGAARLTRITDETGKVYERYEYDARGFVKKQSDALDHLTTYVHDELGRETSRTEASGTDLARDIVTTWDPNHPYLPATIATPTLVTSYTYTPSGRLATRTETDRGTGKQRTTRLTYVWGDGLQVTVDGPRTDVVDRTRFKYDASGNLIRITNALNHVTRFSAHDGAGRPHTVVDPNGLTRRLDYDGRGRLNYLKSGTEETRLTYTPAGDLRTVTLPSNETYAFTWDDARRLTGVSDSAGNRVDYVLDAVGNRVEEKTFAADGTQTRDLHRVFNALGELWQTLNAAGEVTAEYGYNDNEALTTVADGLSHSTVRTWDALNRIDEVTDARSGVATYTWRSDDLIESVTDPNRNTTRYQYNAFGDLLRQESPDTGVTRFTWDTAGNMRTRTDAKGQKATYTYDALNRLVTASYVDGTITYTWDTAENGIGRLATINDFSGTTTFTYDPLGRVKAKRHLAAGKELVTRYDYDSAGRLATITYPSGMVVAYTYTREHVTDILVNGATALTGITYEPFGGPSGWTFGNGQLYQRTVNLDGQLTAHTLGAEQRVLGYNLAGNITSLSDSQTTGLGYDELNRLTSATSPVFDLAWDYDPNGNRQHQRSAEELTTYEYKTGTNRLRAIDAATYALVKHDANGNRTSDGNHRYGYDPRDRLVNVDEGATALYEYNALGERTAKQIATGRRRFAYDGWKLLGEYDADGHALQETVWLGDLPVVTVQTDVSYYIHPDHLGTPRVIADQSGRTVWRWDSEPFGSDEANEDPDGDGVRLGHGLRFPGQYYDGESGLSYNYFRYYDAPSGRYSTSDPIGLYGGPNTYSYVSNDPANRLDMDGLAEICSRALDGALQLKFGAVCHDQIWYDDGTNSGFFDDDTVRSDRAHIKDEYSDCRNIGNDNDVRAAESRVQAKMDHDWRLSSNNCQMYADVVAQEANHRKVNGK
jgi:RHS repeat-associated protein